MDAPGQLETEQQGSNFQTTGLLNALQTAALGLAAGNPTSSYILLGNGFPCEPEHASQKLPFRACVAQWCQA